MSQSTVTTFTCDNLDCEQVATESDFVVRPRDWYLVQGPGGAYRTFCSWPCARATIEREELRRTRP